MRILLIGDYSNMHSQLGCALRMLGHDVTVMSDGCNFQNTARDIDVTRRPGKLSGAMLTFRLLGPLHRHMRGYDVVALQNPHFVTLKPKRLRYIFDRLCGENRSVFLTAAGFDTAYLDMALDPNGPLRYSEWRLGDRPAPFALSHAADLAAWRTPEMRAYHDYVYSRLTGVVSALYEYHIASAAVLGDDKVAYGGIPVDTRLLKPFDMQGSDECVNFFLGRHRERQTEKGTDLLETAARRIVGRYPGHARLAIVENRPWAEYVQLMQSSHVVLDQIYSYSPATNALIAMSHALATVSGAEPEFYRFIGEDKSFPVINAPTDVDALTETLDAIVRERATLAGRGRESREFVVRHNDHLTVARRFVDAWRRMAALDQ